MDHAEALQRLSDPDSDVRVRAARELARSATPDDEDAIRARRRVESVPWVRAALEQALSRSAGLIVVAHPTADEEAPGQPDLASEYSAGLQMTTDRVVHELRSIVGTLRYWAAKEHESFQGSKTDRQIERLRRCLEAIDVLSKVARAPASDEFDIARVVDDEIAAIEERGAAIEGIGPKPTFVVGDSGVLSLVLRNALENGVEAAYPAAAQMHATWGVTPDDHWIAVFDRGPGLPKSAEALFDFGSTTKAGHVGAGLAIVAQAAVAVSGKVALTEEPDGTTKFEFRWPRQVEGGNAVTPG